MLLAAAAFVLQPGATQEGCRVVHSTMLSRCNLMGQTELAVKTLSEFFNLH